MGVDEQSKGVRIYWPDKKSVSVERNVHYRKTDTSASCFKEEIDEIIEMKANDLPKASNPSNKSLPSPCTEMPAPSTSPPASESALEELPAERRIRKPSQHVIDLLEGYGHTSNHPSDPVVTHGIQTPIEVPNVVLEGRDKPNG